MMLGAFKLLAFPMLRDKLLGGVADDLIRTSIQAMRSVVMFLRVYSPCFPHSRV